MDAFQHATCGIALSAKSWSINVSTNTDSERRCAGRATRPGCTGGDVTAVNSDLSVAVISALDVTSEASSDTSLNHENTAAIEKAAGEGDSLAETSAIQQVLTLLTFSIPTLCIAVTNPLLSLIDTAVVGLNSEAHLAAMAPATMVSDSICYLLCFIPIAVTNLVALRMSRNQREAAGVADIHSCRRVHSLRHIFQQCVATVE